MVGLSAVALSSLGFEYNLNNLQYEKARRSPGARETKVRLKKIYSGSISPGAVYLADDLAAVDRFTALLEKAKKEEGSSIGRVRSLRDYAPSASGKEERLMLIEDIKDQLEGKWTRRIEDEGQQELIEDFRRWEVPTSTPLVEEIPGEIRKTLQAKDDSGRFLVTVHPNVDRSDGRNAMAFAEDLYDLEETAGIVGPIGETVVFAEILWIVTSESGWLVALTLAGVFLIVWLNRRSLRDTLWILLPLAAAVSASLGLCALFGFKLNFFNIVVIPALLGMGVDGGVHYYRRWAESGRDVAATQAELFEPLSTAIGTTMIGYSGMIFAGHNGIRSIGIFACLGLSLVWVATLVLLPGMLDWFGGKK
jgi:predicted RND superfamily exporter protein